MSCLGPKYNPIPPRAWSRVNSPCQYESPYIGPIYFPYFKKTIPYSELAFELQMLNKGNVLQYKINSSNLTKKERYSKIAKGQWVNRNTTWATQSQIYTNPNTTSLKRVNYKNITLDGAPTNLPLTCPTPSTPPVYNSLPINTNPSPVVNPPVLPPPPTTTPPSNPPTIPNNTPVTPETPIVIPEGGNLICTVQENICTGEIYSYSPPSYCHPSSDSNVPGPIIDLCWNDGIQTWYPRQRYVMPVSGDKFPQGYKFLKPA